MSMTFIQRVELTGTQSSIVFNSIPQTFTDLVIVGSGRSDRTLGFEDYIITFNGINTGYSWRRLGGDGSSPYADTGSTGRISQIDTDFATANTFGSFTAYIPNYRASTSKSISVDMVTENNATQAFQEIIALLWANNAAISSFTLTTSNSLNFKSGTSVTLYGITAGSAGGVTVS